LALQDYGFQVFNTVPVASTLTQSGRGRHDFAGFLTSCTSLDDCNAALGEVQGGFKFIQSTRIQREPALGHSGPPVGQSGPPR
jgi:hypothetical protein